jgi:5'-3' exonuclease
LAYLLGSDYALGVGKVGPVSGMEILSAFSGYDSNSMELLVSFEKWHNALMSNQITDADQDDYIGALVCETFISKPNYKYFEEEDCETLADTARIY